MNIAIFLLVYLLLSVICSMIFISACIVSSHINGTSGQEEWRAKGARFEPLRSTVTPSIEQPARRFNG